jgi:ring-1,2-phenylacetyl-CoA epoxidase subunit PaaD
MATDNDIARVREAMDEVFDPEIPVLTIADLGILRGVSRGPEGGIVVRITPTYSGCPAMDMIAVNIRAVLQEKGLDAMGIHIETVLSPPWTTDWMSEQGREKLRTFGIAPPLSGSQDKKALLGEKRVLQCPRCGSDHTEMISQFASTSCKAMFRCLDCLETFDYFKCL